MKQNNRDKNKDYNKDNKDNKDLKEKLISFLNLNQKNIREPLNLLSDEYNKDNNNLKDDSKKENLIISRPVEIFPEWPNEQTLKVKN